MASDTLYGTDVSPAELLTRFTHVTRVRVYTEPAYAAYLDSARATPMDEEEMSLVARMKLVRRVGRRGQDAAALPDPAVVSARIWDIPSSER